MASSSSSSPNLHLHLLLLPFLLATAALLLPSASCNEDKLIQIQCDNSPSDHPSDGYDKILSKLLKSPPQTAGSTYYHSGTSHALAWCGGKLSGSRCSTCITKSARKVQQGCSNKLVSALILRENFCYLKLDNKDFIREDDGMRETLIDYSMGKVFMFRRNAFRITVERLMGELIQVVVPRKERRLGVRETVFDKDGSKIYGTGECVNGIDEESCRSCLKGLKSYLMGNCMFFKDCGAVNGRCYLGYHNYKN